MPKVLVLANDHTTIYNFRRELLQRLVRDGFEVAISLPADPRNMAFEEIGCAVVATRLSRFGTNPFSELATLASYLRLIRSFAPDIVLTYTAKPNIYGGLASQLARVPYLTTVTGLGAVFQSAGPLRIISTLLQRVAFRGSRRVFFQNGANLARFRELGIVRDDVAVLPGSGVNLVLHRLEPYNSQTFPIRFITVSRIRKDKGFDELFAAIRRICAARDDVEFHIVGWYEDDTYRETVAEMQNGYPVFVHGSVPQELVHDLIAESHGLIHPSHHEGMANVLLEASATGVPCIASDIPGCREAIDDGTTGLLFAVRESGDLVSAIERFLSHSWEEHRAMGLAAREKMESEFDREWIVDRYLDEIRSACASPTQEASV